MLHIEEQASGFAGIADEIMETAKDCADVRSFREQLERLSLQMKEQEPQKGRNERRCTHDDAWCKGLLGISCGLPPSGGGIEAA